MGRIICFCVLVTVLALTAVAEAAAGASSVIGTWRGSAEEVASPHIQGRAQITVNVMPDGHWTSVWRQAGREQRNAGTWRLTPDFIVFEADSAEAVPPRLSLVHRGDVIYGTALAPLPEGRAATVSIALTHVEPGPVASSAGL
jgi:hypothetical protein